jgi:hypothetical protein
LLADLHQAKGLSCAACHKESPPKSAVPDQVCVACHGGVPAIILPFTLRRLPGWVSVIDPFMVGGYGAPKLALAPPQPEWLHARLFLDAHGFATGPLPLGASGEPIYPAFEGWGPLKEGQNAFLIGYKNDNSDQTLDIPIGPNNHMDPGGPDMLQPTHFEPGRVWGVFAVPVAKDFGTKNIAWTLVANGRTTVVQFSLKIPYWVDFYKNAAKGNTPPVIKFSPDGPEMTGPPRAVALTLNATVGQPLTLKLWAKGAMAVQAAMSLLVLGLVIARAVNIFK